MNLKKTIQFAAAVVLAIGMLAPVSLLTTTQAKADTAAGTTTAIEGTALPVNTASMDNTIWNNANEITTGTWVTGSSGSTAKVQTMWAGDYLYVLAHVKDSLLSKKSKNTYEQDSIEIFVDQNDAKSTSYQKDDGQFRVNFDNEQSYNGDASADNFTTATRVVKGYGYDVLARIKFDAIQPKAGMKIGFDLQVNNDQNGDGSRNSIASWHDATGNSYQDTSHLGTLVLGAAPAATAKASANANPKTGDHSHVSLYFIIALLSCGTIFFMNFRRRGMRKN